MSNFPITPIGAEDAASKMDTALPTLHVGGFGATADACVWEPDPEPGARRMRLWFLSLLGPQDAVKAIWARLIKGETATMSLEAMGAARFCALAPEGPRQWRFLTASLRTVAGYHGVLVPEAARYPAERSDFLLLPRSDAEAPQLHSRFLNRRIDLPLHPLWASWLWERGIRESEIMALESWGLQGYRCIPNPERLAVDLGEALRAGALPVPDSDAAAARAA
jgi:hypothetical protein